METNPLLSSITPPATRNRDVQVQLRIVTLTAAVFLGGAICGYSFRGVPTKPSPPLAVGAVVFQPSLKTLRLPSMPAPKLTACIQTAIERKTFSGALLYVGAPGIQAYVQAVGTDPVGRPIHTDTIFDVASLTKIVVTAPLILRLVADGRFTLETPIRRWFPLLPRRQASITVGQLLTHTSGLPPGASNPVIQPPEISISHESLRTPPGSSFLYSDLGYILLARIVEIERHQSLKVVAQQELFEPTGMLDTGFQPAPQLKSRIAYTRAIDGQLFCGVPQDPVARKLGGVAGHAGLFTTVDDLAKFSELLLNAGAINGNSILPSLVVRYLTSPVSIDPHTIRTYGLDMLSIYSSPKGDLLPFGSFGHTGYSGCSLWIDPISQAVIILLSTGKTEESQKNLNEVRRTIANIIAGSMVPSKD